MVGLPVRYSADGTGEPFFFFVPECVCVSFFLLRSGVRLWSVPGFRESFARLEQEAPPTNRIERKKKRKGLSAGFLGELPAL